MLSDMVECVGERWGMPGTLLVLGENVVCGMAGCGSSWKNNCAGGCVLWGHWLCNAHLRAFGRQKDGDGPDLNNVRPEQPRKRIGKSNKGGARAQTPAAMGYTMADMVLMSIIADRMRATNIENKRLRKKLVKFERTLEESVKKNELLEGELAKQRRETERESWKTRFEESLEKQRKMIEGSDKDKKRWKAEKQELEDSLERSRKRCNGFVAGVAKNLGQFGVEVYHVQEETRGLFITKNKLLEDIRVREQTCEAQLESLKEVQQLAKDLTDKLKKAKREGSQFFLEVQSLELAVQRVNKRGKDEASARKVAEIKGVTVAQTLQTEREEMTRLREQLQETVQERDKSAKNVEQLKTNIQVLENQAAKFKTAKEHTLTKVSWLPYLYVLTKQFLCLSLASDTHPPPLGQLCEAPTRIS
jgi:hypothetical protein